VDKADGKEILRSVMVKRAKLLFSADLTAMPVRPEADERIRGGVATAAPGSRESNRVVA
jgi:hypothetical protein